MKKIYRSLFIRGLLLLLLTSLPVLPGCGLEETDTEKLKDLSYEILEEKDIPEEFLSVIEEKKESIDRKSVV